VHKDAVEGKDYTLEKLMPFWQRTSEQDWEICEANQAGILSPRYQPGPYSTVREINVQHFVDWYLRALAHDPEKCKAVFGQDHAPNEDSPRTHLKAVRA
jgi:phenylpropionate dioxygenase-like ring-hydroxylating dioxygenase large terminal subunit